MCGCDMSFSCHFCVAYCSEIIYFQCELFIIICHTGFAPIEGWQGCPSLQYVSSLLPGWTSDRQPGPVYSTEKPCHELYVDIMITLCFQIANSDRPWVFMMADLCPDTPSSADTVTCKVLARDWSIISKCIELLERTRNRRDITVTHDHELTMVRFCIRLDNGEVGNSVCSCSIDVWVPPAELIRECGSSSPKPPSSR